MNTLNFQLFCCRIAAIYTREIQIAMRKELETNAMMTRQQLRGSNQHVTLGGVEVGAVVTLNDEGISPQLT